MRIIQQVKKVQVQKRFSFPNDPLWPKQWSLVTMCDVKLVLHSITIQYNTGSITKTTQRVDLNVVHAWMQGVAGQGVILTVVDDGKN